MTHYIATKTVIEPITEPITDTVNISINLLEQKFYIDLFDFELGIDISIYLDNPSDFIIEQLQLIDLGVSNDISLDEQIFGINQLSLQEKVYLNTQDDIIISLYDYDNASIGDGVTLNTTELITEILDIIVEAIEKLKFPLVEDLTNTRGITFTKGLTNTKSNTVFVKGLTNTKR